MQAEGANPMGTSNRVDPYHSWREIVCRASNAAEHGRSMTFYIIVLEPHSMYAHSNVKTNTDFLVPDTMKAWVLGDPGQLTLAQKVVPIPAKAEVLVRIDAIAICATDLENIYQGPPAMIGGGLPFNKNWTSGHEYMGTVVALGPSVDEFDIGQRVAVEIHAGCGRCKRCRQGMYTSCLNYGAVEKGHRANGFTTDGGFCEYQINHVNTLVKIADEMSDEEATLVVTAGTAMYGLTELGGLIAGESVVVTGPGPIGLLAVGVAKAGGRSGDLDRHARKSAADRQGAWRRSCYQCSRSGRH
jgi:L-iditol 2-dehydrogenase